MKQRTLILRALALTFLTLAVAGTARADLLPWGYDWTATPADVTAGSGKITLSNETFKTAVGDSQVVATNLKEFSTADPLSPDVFGPTDGNYTLTLSLKDLDTGKTGSLVFKGQLQGKFSAFNSTVTNTFDPATQSQTITLGNTQFTVTLNSYTPPGPPSQGNLGSIGAFVDLKQVPEPTSMALAGGGAAVVALAAWRRRRRTADVAPA